MGFGERYGMKHHYPFHWFVLISFMKWFADKNSQSGPIGMGGIS